MIWAVDHFEGPVLDVCLNRGVVVFPPNEPLCIEDRVLGVHGHLQPHTHTPDFVQLEIWNDTADFDRMRKHIDAGLLDLVEGESEIEHGPGTSPAANGKVQADSNAALLCGKQGVLLSFPRLKHT